MPAALVNAFSYDDKVLLERHIDGRELAVSMIERDGAPQALPIVEAVPRDEDFFDFEARYEIGRTEYRCPPEIDRRGGGGGLRKRRARRGPCSAAGDSRARTSCCREGGEPQVLEVNVTPGLTETSLLPMACEAADIGFDQFVERALELALDRISASTA